MRKNSEIGGLYDLRFALAGLSLDQAARALGVSRRTVTRWETGEITPPRAAWLALRLLAGDLGANHPDWHGWTLRHGGLWAPGTRQGAPIRPGDVAALPYLLHLTAEQARVLREIERPENPAAVKLA